MAKKSKQRQPTDVSSYVNTSFLFPTSNEVERLNSLAKRLYSDDRKSMTPRTLEALIFLKYNRELWNYSMVADVVNKVTESDTSESENEEDGDEFDFFDL